MLMLGRAILHRRFPIPRPTSVLPFDEFTRCFPLFDATLPILVKPLAHQCRIKPYQSYFPGTVAVQQDILVIVVNLTDDIEINRHCGKFDQHVRS